MTPCPHWEKDTYRCGHPDRCECLARLHSAHDWPNPEPPVTVEHPDGTITHEGRRYVPAERIIRELCHWEVIAKARSVQANERSASGAIVSVLRRLLKPSEKEDNAND